MVSLHQTQAAWNRDERNRINENWQRIAGSFAAIQRQINILAGDGEVDELLARIEQALQRAETAVNEYIEQVDVEVKQAIQDNNAATQIAVTNVNNAIAEVNKVLQDAQGLITETNTAKDAAITATHNANEATSNTNAATEAANTATSEANAAIASITELLQTVNEALELVAVRTGEARTATEAANKAAKEADTQAFNAENAMQDATTAASRANEAADQVAGWGTTAPWDVATQFEKNNTVSFRGETWQAKRANKGVEPVEGADWTLIARKGTDGMGSVASVNGVGPDENGNVQLDIGGGDGTVKSVHGELPDAEGNVQLSILDTFTTNEQFNTLVTEFQGELDYLHEEDRTIKGNLENVNKVYVVDGSDPNFTLPIENLEEYKLYNFILTSDLLGTNITINGLPLYKPGTTTSPKLIAGRAYTIWYDGYPNAFFIKASAEGDALASHVLAGKTFSNSEQTGLTGAMLDLSVDTVSGIVFSSDGNYGDVYIHPEKSGYISNGTTVIGIQDPNLTPSNILSGKSIFGVAGSVTPGGKTASGTATSTGTTYAFLNSAGGTASHYAILIPTLEFTPRIVWAFRADMLGDAVFFTKDYFLNGGGQTANIAWTVSTVKFRRGMNVNPMLPVGTANYSYVWFAIE